MAQRIVEILIDDLTGAEMDDGSGESVYFALDGRQYEIDLTTENATDLRSVLQKYVDAARPLGRTSRPRSSSTTRTTRTTRTTIGASPAELRAWGRSNGFQIPDRGRVPGTVREAYDAAH